ncbi:MAG: hypothetical protein IJL89_01075 [Firmicutes bacterium]|nr:hypothetical protein [Bacillota bacterium]
MGIFVIPEMTHGHFRESSCLSQLQTKIPIETIVLGNGVFRRTVAEIKKGLSR